MPIKPTSILPELLKQISNKYTCHLNQENKTQKHKELLLELHAIFGEVLHSALRLLDEQQVIVYGSNTKLREFVEITEHRKSAKVIKLYPGVNFCTCDFFVSNVLNVYDVDKPRGISSPSTRYTCAHVLAIYLAQMLKLSVMRDEILPKHNFNYLLSGMMLPKTP